MMMVWVLSLILRPQMNPWILF
uniref:Uncharacterized protein n=1 Tax=Anguilla anguilla TaxID=7936 RepID=A0A0E9VW80_ANGAN